MIFNLYQTILRLHNMKNKPIKNNIPGFTLVEVMVSLAVFAVLITILLSSFNLTLKSWNVSEGLVESQQNARISLDWLSMEMHEAVNYSDMTTSVLYPSVTLSVSTNTTCFTKPLNMQSMFTTSFLSIQTISYYVDNNKDLKRAVYSNGAWSQPFIIASNIDTIFISHALQDTTDTYSYPDNVYDPKFFTISVFTKTPASDPSQVTKNFNMITNIRIRNNP
jgi:prepilin-type N-terminal cleavage/methylation domain-containing protein